MRSFFKTNISVLLILTMLLAFTSCTEETESRDILYETITNVKFTDPQLASNDTELEVVYNTFEGLMKYDKSGKLINGVASSYTVSSDKLTYTFEIPNGLKWSNGQDFTAEDFEFGFRRAVNPKTEAPLAYSLQAIKNAPEILNGDMLYSKIGVKAIDKNTLQIKLAYPMAGFLELLTTPICMPCNRNFFDDSKGYYGLKPDTIIGNGEYTITEWNSDYCSLEKNEQYKNAKTLNLRNVYIYFNDEDTLYENIEKNETDFTVLDNNMLGRIKKSDEDMSLKHISDTTLSLLINKKATIAEENIKTALMSTVSFSISKEFSSRYGVSAADSILPGIISKSSNKLLKIEQTISNKKANELYLTGCSNLEIDKIFPSFSIIYIDDEITTSIAKQIAAKWQSTFGVVVNIKPIETKEELESTLNTGNYDAAIVPTTAVSGSAFSYLQQFTSDSSLNYFGYNNSSYDKLIKKLGKSSGDAEISYTQQLITKISKYNNLKPLFTASKIYYYKPDLKLSINENNKTVYFSYIK